MILVDTSVWVDHLRSHDPELAQCLGQRQVAVHPWVIGELACGQLRNRQEVLGLLGALPAVAVAGDQEVLLAIEQNRLMGRGIGYVDAHLISSALLSRATLWTRDKRLGALARDLDLAY